MANMVVVGRFRHGEKSCVKSKEVGGEGERGESPRKRI